MQNVEGKIRMIHYHTHDGKNKIGQCNRYMNLTVILHAQLVFVQFNNISTNIVVKEAKWVH